MRRTPQPKTPINQMYGCVVEILFLNLAGNRFQREKDKRKKEREKLNENVKKILSLSLANLIKHPDVTTTVVTNNNRPSIQRYQRTKFNRARKFLRATHQNENDKA